METNDFIGRTKELAQLGADFSDLEPNITVIFGRRRVGKSRLIQEAVQGKEVLWFDGVENQSKKSQIDAFLMQLEEQTGRKPDTKIHEWREAFLLLHQELKERPQILVFDEFQWMANYRREIVSDLKLIWDRYWSRIPEVSLVLCGSIASFMMEKVIRSQALYGRATSIIHLKPFSLMETQEFLGNCGTQEVLEAQMILGGIPQYLKLASKGPSLRISINDLAFRPNGSLFHEYDRIFVSHFGNNDIFEHIVRLLGKHPLGLFRPEIAKYLAKDAGGHLSQQLRDLESAGFITSTRPIDKGSRSNLVKYALTDSYLRFYFAFIEPHKLEIESDPNQDLLPRIAQTGQFHAWIGTAFEHICRDHAHRISEILGFSGIQYTHGPLMRPARAGEKGFQIDLLFDRADNVITLCEMKYHNQPIGVSVLNELRKRVQRLGNYYIGKSIQPVLIVKEETTKELEASLEIFRIIRARELFQ